MGHFVSGLLRRLRDARRSPGSEGRLTAGFRRPTGSLATTPTTMAPSFCTRNSIPTRSSVGPRPAPTTKEPPRFGPQFEGCLRFLPRFGPVSRLTNATSWGNGPSGTPSCDTVRTMPSGRNGRSCHISRNVKPAVLTVGGWFDAEDLFGSLHAYQALERAGPKAQNVLVMGPWDHGGWAYGDGDALGAVHFDVKTAAIYREQVEFPFFEHHLRDGGECDLPKAVVFRTGRNQWQACDRPGRRGRRSPGRSSCTRAASWHSSRRPAQPRRNSTSTSATRPSRCPYIRTRSPSAARRLHDRGPAVRCTRGRTCWSTSPTCSDEDCHVAGPIQVELAGLHHGHRCDWVVKLIDVYPDDYPEPEPEPGTGVRMGGYQQLVRGDVMRGKFRNSFEKPEPFVPGKPTMVRFTMPDVYHTFRTGHRIMVQVQSTLVPAGGPQPADVLSTSTAPRNRTSIRRLNGCITRRSVRLTLNCW